jgi:hydroxymethylpyrimidine pyrophosphatase-like HAD family hydrolase
VGQLISQSRANGEVLELYSDREYVTESTAPWARAHADLLGLPFRKRDFESLQGAAVRAQWLVSRAQASVMLQSPSLDLEIAQSTSPLMPDTQFVGLTAAGINKGTALRAIAAEYAIDLKDAMYVGDSGNDLAALRVVGYPIAMANAEPAVIGASVLTVGHVDEGGVAQALEFAAIST